MPKDVDPYKLRRFTIWLDPQLHKAIRRIAYHEERNISDVTRELLTDALKRRSKTYEPER